MGDIVIFTRPKGVQSLADRVVAESVTFYDLYKTLYNPNVEEFESLADAVSQYVARFGREAWAGKPGDNPRYKLLSAVSSYCRDGWRHPETLGAGTLLRLANESVVAYVHSTKGAA